MKKLIVLFTRGVLKAAILTTVVSLCLSLSPLEPALAAGGGSKRICSFLGDDPKPSILDQDIFAFNGKKGEKITVTLEVDSSGAHTGKRVNLSLMDEITRTFFFRTTTKKEIGVKEIGVRSTLLTYQQDEVSAVDKRHLVPSSGERRNGVGLAKFGGKGLFLQNYVVRIYRREKNDPRILVGVVEEVGVDGNRAFSNLDELWSILNPSRVESAKTKKRNKSLKHRKQGELWEA